ncbi:MAG TPA: M14 family zinc carboxypeptidase [Pseudonocardiaceae bacterium]|nr:M14 family zinc carboxypeptidase [Pseudonocardiaceae bacterium]
MGARTRISAGLAAATSIFALLPAVPAFAAPAGCDPTTTPAVYRGEVPEPREVLGFDLGEREVTAAESDRYLDAVAAASPRAVAGTLATSWQGRPLRYAIAGRPDRVTPAGLRRLQASTALLRDPHTPADVARRTAEQLPAILWVTGNVHGNEESGADAALRTLRDIADREDCAAKRILNNAVVVVMPVQNPDGREADTRRNSYGFDLNRDWFARTQAETDGKLELLRQLPPVLFIDAHEMGGTSYFFPPNADPVYHEIAEASMDWIDNRYGPAMAAEFTRRGIDFFNAGVYDLFYMGYGDTVPTTGFLAAGMTFEKGNSSPIAERTLEQYLTQWVSLSVAADARTTILSQWHAAHVQAYQQGQAGLLEPNQVYNEGNEVLLPVPDRLVRHYFIRTDDPAHASDAALVIRRLQRMGVQVGRLTQPLAVPDYREYGRPPAPATLPAGTYWISLAQPQKHWVQAMLNEDTYTPFPYFYDVTGWSLPLLGNVGGGSSGAVLAPAFEPAAPVAAPAPPALPAPLPSVGVLELSATSTSAIESTGWLRYRLEREWRLPYRLLRPADVAAGALSGIDVLLVPNGPAPAAYAALGAAGRAALTGWVQAGGRYVGWRGGALLAARLGLTSAQLANPTSDVPGSLLRVQVAPGSPLGAGVGPTAWQFYEYDLVMRATDPATVAVSYPPAASPDWFISGFASGAEELGGTAAAVDEAAGAGRSVLFAGEPNFRAFTDGTAKLLFNAIFAPAAPAAAAAAARADAALAAAGVTWLESPIRVTVEPADADRAAAVLRGFDPGWIRLDLGDRVAFALDNPTGLTADEHPWAVQLVSALHAAGVRPRTVALP